jgi:hypothetical protein
MSARSSRGGSLGRHSERAESVNSRVRSLFQEYPGLYDRFLRLRRGGNMEQQQEQGEDRRDTSRERERERERTSASASKRSSSSSTSTSNSRDSSVDRHLSRMRSDTVGQILLGLVQENTILSKKVGLKESGISIKNMARDYCKHLEAQDRSDQEENRLLKALEDRMLQKELDSHLLGSSFDIPTFYGINNGGYSLDSLMTRSEANKVFPNKGGRFGGNDGESVLEFLLQLNNAQETLKLNEKDFLKMVRLSTTGKAHQLVSEMLDNGADTSSIYHALLLHYDTRQTSSEAKKALYAYRVKKDENLAKATSHISTLAHRSVSDLPIGPARTIVLDMESCSALIRSLPPASSAIAQNTFSSLSAKLGRNCTFHEFCRALNVYRASIDQDIKVNGKDTQSGNSGGGKKKNWWGNKKAADKMGGFQVNVISQPSTSKPDPKKVNSQGGPSKKALAWLNKPYCSLCGDPNHRAADGCPIMRNDLGKVVKVTPCYSPCKSCPRSRPFRLNHPESLCPYREKGPWRDRE